MPVERKNDGHFQKSGERKESAANTYVSSHLHILAPFTQFSILHNIDLQYFIIREALGLFPPCRSTTCSTSIQPKGRLPALCPVLLSLSIRFFAAQSQPHISSSVNLALETRRSTTKQRVESQAKYQIPARRTLKCGHPMHSSHYYVSSAPVTPSPQAMSFSREAAPCSDPHRLMPRCTMTMTVPMTSHRWHQPILFRLEYLPSPPHPTPN